MSLRRREMLAGAPYGKDAAGRFGRRHKNKYTHEHSWRYYGGMASCECGMELLPNGVVRPNRNARRHNKRGR